MTKDTDYIKHARRTPRVFFAGLLAGAVGLLSLSIGLPDVAASELRTNVQVEGEYILLGDLFTDVEGVADVIVANAPAPGEQTTLSVNEILPIAQQYGIDWERPRQLIRVRVERSGYPVVMEDLEGMIIDAIHMEGGPERFEMSMHGQLHSIYLPMDKRVEDIFIEAFSYDRRSKRFRATVSLPLGKNNVRRVMLSGALNELVSVPLLARPIGREEIITASDVIWVDYPKNRLGQNIILAKTALVGKAARRGLRPDTPLRTSDVQNPILIKKGTLVTMKIKTGPLSLSAVGRAAENGSRGDIIRIVNVDSHQTIEGRVTGPDQVDILFSNQLSISGS